MIAEKKNGGTSSSGSRSHQEQLGVAAAATGEEEEEEEEGEAMLDLLCQQFEKERRKGTHSTGCPRKKKTVKLLGIFNTMLKI